MQTAVSNNRTKPWDNIMLFLMSILSTLRSIFNILCVHRLTIIELKSVVPSIYVVRYLRLETSRLMFILWYTVYWVAIVMKQRFYTSLKNVSSSHKAVEQAGHYLKWIVDGVVSYHGGSIWPTSYCPAAFVRKSENRAVFLPHAFGGIPNIIVWWAKENILETML